MSGGRNIALTKIAGKLRAQGFGEQAICAELLSHPERNGLPEAEVRAIARSIGAKPPGDPRPALKANYPDALHELSDRRRWTMESMRTVGAVAKGPEVHIPMRDASGEICGWKRRRGDNGLIQTKDGPAKSVTKSKSNHGLFIPKPFPEDGPVLVTEGETDTVAALSAGHAATVGTAGSNPGKGGRAAIQKFLAGREVVLCPDPDPPGRKWLSSVGELLLNVGATVRYVPGDPQAGDLDKRLNQADDKAAALRELVAAAVEWKPSGDKRKPAADKGPRPLTDLGNAERFRDQHQGKVLFDVRVGRWRRWDGRCWRLDETSEAVRRAATTARAIYREAANEPNEKHRDALAAWARRSEARERLAAMVGLAQTLEGMVIEPTEWDSDLWALNVNNGTIDLKTGELRAHSPGDYCTRLAPVDFIPNATHATWDKVISEAIPDAEERGFLQRLLGYSLVAEKYEKALGFFYGPKDTAKSTILESVQKTLGDYAVVVEPEALMKKDFNSSGPSPELARLDGARLVVTSETSENQQMNAGLIKRLSGGGATLTARECRANTQQFDVTFLICFQSNSRPRVRADDDAFFGRLKVVPFEQVIAKERRDPAVKRTLESDPAARSAILWWLVEGCVVWQRNGLGEAQAIERATAAYQGEMDPLRDFFETCCRFGLDARMTAKALRAAYESWAREEGIKERSFASQKSLGTWLTRKGCTSERVDRQRGWRGVELCPSVSDVSDVSDSPGSISHEENKSEFNPVKATQVTQATQTAFSDETEEALIDDDLPY